MANNSNILDMMTSNENLSKMYGIENQSCPSCACAQRNQQAQAQGTGTTNNTRANTTAQLPASTNNTDNTRRPVFMDSIDRASTSGSNSVDEETEEYIEESLATPVPYNTMTSDDSLNALLSTMSGGMANQIARNQASSMSSGRQTNQMNNMSNAMSMPRRSATEVNLQNMNGFLKTQTGKNISVQFLIGNNALLEKTGTLLAVGDNYILMRESDNNEILLCDFDNIKFIRFLS